MGMSSQINDILSSSSGDSMEQYIRHVGYVAYKDFIIILKKIFRDKAKIYIFFF